MIETPVHFHKIHRWFAWRPVFVADHGYVWLRMVYRQYTSKWHANGQQTWVKHYWLEKPANRPEDAE